ncbi:MAG: TonB-dependent receptor [Gammaproteobacteria bacterium]|jgi:outer membrane receptor protein involved in Fe transport
MKARLRGNAQLNGLLAMTPLAAMVSAAFAPAVLAQEEEADEVIYVTGTRIPQPDFEFSNPVTSIDAEQIQYAGATNLLDFIQEVPALVNSYDLEDGADTSVPSTAGLNLLNLRNLGTDRTLVLVNGRRHVAGDPGSAAVDINTIPTDLIERVDILTGGASALYGADGVSGVVNFVLKDDFEGITSRVQVGSPDQGGGDNTFVSILGGHNFGGGRGNVTVSLEHSSIDPVERDDRDYARLGQRQILVDNPDDLADDPDVVDNILSTDVRYIDTSPEGSLYTDLDFGFYGNFGTLPDMDELAGYDYLGNGEPFEVGEYAGGFFMIGGSGTLLDEFEDELLPGLDRTSLNSTFRWDLSGSHSLFAEAKVGETESTFIGQPTFDFYLPVDLDNAFAPAVAVAEASDFDNGLGYIEVARDNIDLGPLYHDIDRKTSRFVLGFEGDLPKDGWRYEVSYGYGKSEEDHTIRNVRIEERWLAAIDAVDDGNGNIVCRSDLDPNDLPFDYPYPDFGLTFTPGAGSGCVPADIFGRDVSDAARDWITTTLFRPAEIKQEVFSGYVSGDSGRVTLPGGPIGFAAGIEYRKEEAESYAADEELQATELGYDVTWYGQGTNTIGEFDVQEYFGEISLPLLADKKLARELTIDAAFRKSDYSTAGTTDTYKSGFLWRPVEMAMFRTTRARAVRAPNISELFLPQTQTFELLDDPCDQDNVDAGTSFRYANCAAALGFDPNTFNDTLSSAVEGRIGGNPNLTPEKADTVTYGMVLSPLDSLTFAVDYFDIQLENSINFFEAQTILDKCYDLPVPNQFCPLIQRDPGTGLLDSFEEYAVNVAEYNTKGYDYTLRYQTAPMDIGQFRLSVIATRLDELVFVEIADAEPDRDVGEPGAPEYQAVLDLTWFRDSWTINYGYSWFDETDRFSRERLASDPDYVDPSFFKYSAREVHDIYARYDLENGLSIFGGVNNLTDQEPDLGSINRPVNPLGRFAYFGVNYTLN